MSTYTAGQKLRASDLNHDLASGTDAQYNANATQTVTTGTQPIVAFGQQNKASSLVTRSVSGAGHKFDLGRSGIWAITCCIRWAGANTGERYVLLNSDAGGLCSAGAALSVSSPFTVSPSATVYLASGTDVWVEVFQNSGGNRDLEFNNSTGWNRINFVWLHD